MNGTLADVIGLAGSAMFIAAFTYATFSPALDKLWFNIANLIGAILLLVSLSVHFNLAAFVMESAWGLIALVGLISELHQCWEQRRGRRAP